MVIVGILLLIVFGPGKLPSMARDLGGFVSKARRQIDELKEEFVSGGGDEPGLVSSAEDESDEQEKTFDLAIKEGTMTPGEITVDEGDEVTLWVTSDNPVRFRLNGYYLSAKVEPGNPLDLPFEADLAGRFEIEDERAKTGLGGVLVGPRQEAALGAGSTSSLSWRFFCSSWSDCSSRCAPGLPKATSKAT